MIGFIIQTTVILGILWFIPALGDIRDYLGQTGLFIVAVGTSSVLFLIWDVLMVPVELDRKKTVDLQRVFRIVGAIEQERQVEERLLQLVETGKSRFEAAQSPTELHEAHDAWQAECLAFLEQTFRPSSILEFRHPPDLSAYGISGSNPVLEKIARQDAVCARDYERFRRQINVLATLASHVASTHWSLEHLRLAREIMDDPLYRDIKPRSKYEPLK